MARIHVLLYVDQLPFAALHIPSRHQCLLEEVDRLCDSSKGLAESTPSTYINSTMRVSLSWFVGSLHTWTFPPNSSKCPHRWSNAPP